MKGPNSYAVLGATGNCGTALIENLLRIPEARVHAYCRSKSKLLRLLPAIGEENRVEIFEGNIQDVELITSCVQNCRAVFLVVSTNDNIPHCRLAQDTATAVIQSLRSLKDRPDNAATTPMTPKLVLLSSSTIDDHLSSHAPALLRWILLSSASHVYSDLVKTEKLLRAEEEWLTTIYMKPGALSVDTQRGHILSLDEQESPVSYLDLAAAMIEAVNDENGNYDLKNISVLNANGKAKFPAGTPLCILVGLLRHFFPFLHHYLPLNTGPR
ncbi:hypothetical protein QQS21_007623 [Conoideocrella luteorostrata]|uniref:NAD(P)-binding domain-containing protein n=1 Tax=Conoideocrella luteorostrata TaxID=1105319 RepID=A0AAJ0CL63_9HYPO|nr:hypothetical protein QQS21_007623 [Conoideocrella luteorostrata]